MTATNIFIEIMEVITTNKVIQFLNATDIQMLHSKSDKVIQFSMPQTQCIHATVTLQGREKVALKSCKNAASAHCKCELEQRFGLQTQLHT